MSRHMSIPTEIKTETPNLDKSKNRGSVTPPPPARSFSGQVIKTSSRISYMLTTF